MTADDDPDELVTVVLLPPFRPLLPGDPLPMPCRANMAGWHEVRRRDLDAKLVELIEGEG